MRNPTKGLTVTAIAYKGYITAFYNELPGLVVQGTSNDDVKVKLMFLMDSYIKRLDSIKNNIDIKTECIA
jgi:hypothetical protein